MKEIDRMMVLPSAKEREIAVKSFLKGRSSLYAYSVSTVCDKKELEWPTRFIRMNFVNILKTLLTRRKPNVSIPSPTDPP